MSLNFKKGKIMPNYRLRWKTKNEDEDDLKASEKILYNIKPIVQVRILKVCENRRFKFTIEFKYPLFFILKE